MASFIKNKKDIVVDVSLAGVQNFLDFAQEANVHSIAIGANGKKIKVTRNPQAKAKQVVETAVDHANKPEQVAPKYEQVRSTHIGSFHHIKGIVAGTSVKAGDVVANIYSMKIEHAIRAGRDCVIQAILVEENDVIEYGQPLFNIE